jgi:hypothetical protein
MHYLPSLYSVTTPLHISGPFVAHHQQVECVYMVNGDCFTSVSGNVPSRPADGRLRSKTIAICHRIQWTLELRPA